MIRRRQAIALALAAWVGGGAPAAQAQSLGLAGGEVLRGRFTQQRFLQGFNAPLTSSGSFISRRDGASCGAARRPSPSSP